MAGSERSSGATGGGARSVFGLRSVVGQMFVLQLVVVVLLALGAIFLLLLMARQESHQEAGSRSLALAEGFAHAPGTAAAIVSPDPTAVLQPRAEAARKGAEVSFVVVLNRQGIRLTHPLPDRIGKMTSTDIKPLLAGETVVEDWVGTLGPQVRAYVPVRGPDGTVVGAVGAGVTVASIQSAAREQLPAVLGATGAAVLLSTGGAALLSRRLLRQTHGLGPTEITRMYEHHDAVLHSVREGVVIVGRDGRLQLVNDEARRLLRLPEDAEGRAAAGLELPPGIADLLVSGREATDELYEVGNRTLAISQRPTESTEDGGPAAESGRVATVRDTTELLTLSGRAEAAQRRLGVVYEAGMRIGTTLDVRRTARELAETAVGRFADFVTVDLVDAVLRGEELHGAERDVRRIVVAGVRDGAPFYSEGSRIELAPATPQARAMSTGRPVLKPVLRNAPGWLSQDPEGARRLLDYGVHSLLAAPLLARGTLLGVVCFWRAGPREPFDADDLALAEEVAARAAVSLDNARRYTREHTMAVTLQHSLMPRYLPVQEAVEVAYRYLPAQAGVGGDWFDVIPLPGARVALVVGDVVGHGLHAAATMGRLRTAVHNFSALDLPPDDILSHLDELVDRMDQERTPGDDGPDVTGATCLYAVYDPVTGDCVMARAGHPPPVLVHPDGSVVVLDVPVSPPLGTGSGLPVETARFTLPEGARIVFYTDGLVERPDRDIDTGLGLLIDAVAGQPGLDPEETCRAVLTALPGAQPRDDIALLVARIHRLDPERIAEWQVPSDTAAVAPVRAECAAKLQAWGLEEIVFTTELILSELITNAIRYASQPITVRMIHSTSLICEVFDGSSTAPHLRRAAITDEGGRGLFLVAQLADRWGTRYTARGKAIWTEQNLQGPGGAPSGGPDLTDALLDHWNL
ncbi:MULTISPECIES: SpoIIE family protein phosphatase [Streptomyces]|uniref:protein-serine/threonine phosphatase n=1 Tax=Streptomyces tsukubensis (strain DSM 42081 / NBRC 108919 / NRRL 18488 / 9993) TaxID=1114943 RepID=I2N3E3_STRT9|nr:MULTISPECIES: SpoIIE family protein phosphatase [Streptomyces]AZK95623.1 histidine kinase [Streptomyces tsukubensis]EIF91540.1 signal transduction histidine kinase regulating citrate/malate metabolism [Streptomyces tsukubensis NRRL18488]MYS68414.1 SpoIIE family protein phosphatase [Streptomyces sp. SID5473]QKM68343.1 PAS domain-containing protein [Streptomyces tsukubensis NRRL18488]TAI43161.1 GAF domain-containing protein [Streptomyces tsukubensis]